MSVRPTQTECELGDCRVYERAKDLKAPHYVGRVAIPMLCRSYRKELIAEGI